MCTCHSISDHSDEAYRMDRQRGKLVLICNTKFNAELNLKERKGTDKDIAAIKRVFQDILHFEVVEYKQLRVHEMLRYISAGLWQTVAICILNCNPSNV